MRFLLDENISKDAAMALRNEGHDVVWIPETPLRGSDDDLLWLVSLQERRVFVTADLGFPRGRPRPPAMILLRGFDRVSTTTEARFLLDTVRELGDDLEAKLIVVSLASAM